MSLPGDKISVDRFFDNLYTKHDRYWWLEDTRYSTNPTDHRSVVWKTLLELLRIRPPGKALDIGSGEGADAIRLAILGYDVDAVEISTVGTNKIRSFAQKEGVIVNVFQEDIRSFGFNKKYDVVICHGVLHFMNNNEKIKVLQQIKDATIPGGINSVSSFTDFNPLPDFHRITKVYCDNEHGILHHFFQDWKKHLVLIERNKLDIQPGFPPHFHSYVKIIAEKPQTTKSNALK